MNHCETCGVQLEESQIGMCDECLANEKNDNCLEGMRCPKCKSIEPFQIVLTCLATVFDSGVTDTVDPEWNDDSRCTCSECGHGGTVKDFKNG